MILLYEDLISKGELGKKLFDMFFETNCERDISQESAPSWMQVYRRLHCTTASTNDVKGAEGLSDEKDKLACGDTLPQA